MKYWIFILQKSFEKSIDTLTNFLRISDWYIQYLCIEIQIPDKKIIPQICLIRRYLLFWFVIIFYVLFDASEVLNVHVKESKKKSTCFRRIFFKQWKIYFCERKFYFF